jgi:YggT family protein
MGDGGGRWGWGFTPWRRVGGWRRVAPALRLKLTQNIFMFRILRAFINFVVGIIELLLTFRLIFKFLVVNSGTPFVAWLYNFTAPLVAPFAKILPNWKISGFVVDFATVAAIIVFALAGSLLLMLFPYPRKVAVTYVTPASDQSV